MHFILNTLTTILENIRSREVPSGPDSDLPNISTHRNLRATTRSRSARLHTAKSTTRLHKHRFTANRVFNSEKNTPTAGTGATHGAQPIGAKYRRATCRLAGGRPLQRCNTALVPQPVHPQPPGAFTSQPSFVVPGRPDLDDRNLPPLFAQKLFSDAKVKEDLVFLRASEERKERAMDSEYARQLEEAHAARRKAEEEERARLHEAERFRAMQEEANRQHAENLRKSWEARRRAVKQERLLRLAEELEATERARREYELHKQERLEQDCREQERLEQYHSELEQERRDHEAAQSNHAKQIQHYEDRWTRLRSSIPGTEPLKISDFPWPWFDNVQCLEDITDERVMEFVGHPIQRHMQAPSGGLAKATRFEMLCWHPDKFDGQVLNQVVGEHREIVKAAAGRIARILITSNEKMREL